ncbi:MAG: Spy/CpxP family protein refolding chaperone [Elusimicrobia bacterium]|nr:Spy/CpxP family protein refolding chaperone [Candidatus Liberimonas magnetica]
MKIKLLMVLLLLSLGFNLGVFVTFGHHCLLKKYFEKGPKESSWHKNKIKKMLNLSEEQALYMEKDRKALQDTINPLKDELKAKRAELFAMLDSDSIDNSKVDKLIGEISVLQMKIEKNVVDHSLNIRKQLTPEQQKKFKEFLKKGFEKMSRGPGFMHEDKKEHHEN